MINITVALSLLIALSLSCSIQRTTRTPHTTHTLVESIFAFACVYAVFRTECCMYMSIKWSIQHFAMRTAIRVYLCFILHHVWGTLIFIDVVNETDTQFSSLYTVGYQFRRKSLALSPTSAAWRFAIAQEDSSRFFYACTRLWVWRNSISVHTCRKYIITIH